MFLDRVTVKKKKNNFTINSHDYFYIWHTENPDTYSQYTGIFADFIFPIAM